MGKQRRIPASAIAWGSFRKKRLIMNWETRDALTFLAPHRAQVNRIRWHFCLRRASFTPRFTASWIVGAFFSRRISLSALSDSPSSVRKADCIPAISRAVAVHIWVAFLRYTNQAREARSRVG